MWVLASVWKKQRSNERITLKTNFPIIRRTQQSSIHGQSVTGNHFKMSSEHKQISASGSRPFSIPVVALGAERESETIGKMHIVKQVKEPRKPYKHAFLTLVSLFHRLITCLQVATAQYSDWLIFTSEVETT